VIVEVAIGDAYGAGFEFSSREKVERLNTLSMYVEHESASALATTPTIRR